ncbi:16S rRNA (guanine(966)-N(2))-methyltransferase RsmD [Rhodohalobacter mucosus]|uniref:16S rRNA (Guanine(966)-N(2))-methyltransferase RsmD n=1 Tax=Rhodohalobacter mucosus TaxID=2079485 RepID=A0A316TZJ4_9BACT|nr:16S rRNA (guanine(966)-N(2))-methyltransferase RsmD [Rhodohalobacter mucosus]PWN05576.1 16S rRNA (guanine(966)-N(2))-methyltransferase RsmD [Rhodohalobacter mucosus]
MRIITGKLKGRTIPVPKSGLLRPTSDRAKEGIFSIIAARTYFDNTRVLDLFAGSGNLGFEAISRGAENCLFVDREHQHIRHIEKLAKQFQVETQIQTIAMDVETFLERSTHGSYDFIFADPPYDYHRMEEMTESILNNDWLNKDGWYILEHDKRHDFSGHSACIHCKSYGRTTASIFRPDASG